MPQLNVVSSPSPVVPAVDSAGPASAPSAGGVAASGPNGQAATSFATVLQNHLAQPDDGKAAIVMDVLLGSQGTADGALAAATATSTTIAAAEPTDPAADPQADAIALLAQMLTGIVPAQPAVVSTSPKQDADASVSATQENEGAATSPIVIAAPVTPIPTAVPNIPIVTSIEHTPVRTSAQAAAQPVQAAPVTATLEQPSAILAATKPTATESPAETGNTAQTNSPQVSFDSLLNAAREAPTAVAAHNAAAANAAPPPAAPVVAAVTTPVGVRGWDSEIGEKLTWMVGRHETRAELVLNPPQLGRIEVSLSMNGDQANATFVSANPAVREALENAVPHLREILQGAGISLGQTQVGAESFQQQANNRENGDNPSRGSDRAPGAITDGVIAGSSTPAQWLRRGNGLVDTFA